MPTLIITMGTAMIKMEWVSNLRHIEK